VQKSRADGAGVGALEAREQVAQLHRRLAGDAAGAEFLVQVGRGQVMEIEFQIRRRVRRRQPERIELCAQMAARAVSRDQAADIAAQLLGFGRGRAAAVRVIGEFRSLHDAEARVRMRHVTGFAPLEGFEVRGPLRAHAGRIGQPLFVQVFDEIGVAAGQLRGLLELLDQAAHGCLARPALPVLCGGEEIARRHDGRGAVSPKL